MKAEMIDLENQIAQIRARQVVLVNELERSQAPQTDGSRSMVEYVQANTDVDSRLASDIVFAARKIAKHRHINFPFADGKMTFDRMMATLRYADSGAQRPDLEASYERDLAGVRRLTLGRRRITPTDERSAHAERYFVSQPSLDLSHFRFWGQLGGIDGHTLEKAMVERADELHRESPDLTGTRGQRQADAMVCMALDSLDRAGTSDDIQAFQPCRDGGRVTVFVDARHNEAPERAAEVEFGPRVGPDALERLLCTGTVRVVGMEDETPVVTTASTRRIPPAIRDAVALRDGGCSIDGCQSRYRLQPHHIVRYSDGGSHHPDNLATLCWYHHHVAVHQAGYHINPATPRHRRRLHRAKGVPRGHPPGLDPP